MPVVAGLTKADRFPCPLCGRPVWLTDIQRRIMAHLMSVSQRCPGSYQLPAALARLHILHRAPPIK